MAHHTARQADQAEAQRLHPHRDPSPVHYRRMIYGYALALDCRCAAGREVLRRLIRETRRLIGDDCDGLGGDTAGGNGHD